VNENCYNNLKESGRQLIKQRVRERQTVCARVRVSETTERKRVRMSLSDGFLPKLAKKDRMYLKEVLRRLSV
jgi:hypothetical protein